MKAYSFISTKYRRNSKLLLSAVGLAFFVILLGAYTRLTNAGLSCPDWPHCYGFLTAPSTDSQIKDALTRFPAVPVDVKKAWTEMAHRYAAGTEGLLILIFALPLLIGKKNKSIKGKFIAFSLMSILFLQIALGMWTVTEKLRPFIVLSHLLMGLSLLSVLWWAYLDLNLEDDSFIAKAPVPFLPFFWLGFFIVILQIALGGWVSTHYAGLACIDFPFCNSQLLPVIKWNALHSDLISIHMLHRIGALITAAYLTLFSLYLATKTHFRSLAFLILGLLGTQLTLGVLNIIWLRPIWIALAHDGVAIILLLTLITILVKAHFAKRVYRYGSFLQ